MNSNRRLAVAMATSEGSNVLRGEVRPTKRDQAHPPVATVIPTYNPGPFLAHTLSSLESQTVPPAEVIVVDDGSQMPVRLPDSSLPIQVIRAAHGGISSARNAGVRASSSPLVHILDHDDVIAPHMYRTLLGVFSDRPEVDVVHALTGFIDARGVRLAGQFPSSVPDYHDGGVAQRLLNENWLGSVATVFRREVFDALGGFRPFHFVQDWDFWIRAAMDGWRFEVVPELLGWHREHSDKQVKPENLEAIHRESMQMHRSLHVPLKLRWWLARRAADDHLRLARILFGHDSRKRSILTHTALAFPLRPLRSTRMVSDVCRRP